ncbi:MAG: acyltransferase [Coriobacteriaceae bacterium]|nr:acyltransferase [Coriobacteriaceae bacterium]
MERENTHRNAARRPHTQGQSVRMPERRPSPGTPGTSPSKKSTRYVASIDGLRAFAVMAVIFYHMHLDWAPGGLMGVTIFFVISGYLITGLLVNERETTGRIDLPAFWMRRVRRLFPAIVFSVTGICALCVLFNAQLFTKMQPDIVPSLFFFNNWWQIFHEVSYFDAAGSPSPLQHFWSLSIEEQFYLVWPLLLILMFALGASRKAMRRVVAVLAVASAAAMAMLYDPLGDPSRVYYGTDTRAMSLLVGAWLALAWPSAAFGGARRMKSHAQRFGIEVLGIVALAALVNIVVLTNGFTSFPYYGGIALTSVFSAMLIAALVVPGTFMDAVFALKPLVWIGKRSYGMYLWHFPILLLTTNVNSTVEPPIWLYFVQIVLIFLVSHLSYEYIENPIRKGAIRDWLQARRAGQPHPVRASAVVSAATVCCLLAVSGVGLAKGPVGLQLPAVQLERYLPALPDAPGLPGLADVAGGLLSGAPVPSAPSNVASENGPDSPSASGAAATSAAQLQDRHGQAVAETAEARAKAEKAKEKARSKAVKKLFGKQRRNDAGEPIYEPLVIGDSVAAGTDDAFSSFFPCGKLDAEVGRNIWQSPYADYAAADQVGEYVVFCLGTNNAVEDWQIDDELLKPVAKDKKVFLVNIRAPEDFEASTNRALAEAVERNENVVGLIDWYGASTGHDEYFWGDGTHLTPEGEQAYLSLIADSVKGYAREHIEA